MQNQLIAVSPHPVGSDSIPTVNARELYDFLGVKTPFKDWIARRIEDFDFVEDQDFCSFLRESSGGRPSKDYHLTLDMAKELSMVERNDKGKQARQYFIECEKVAKQTSPALAIPQTLPEALRLAADLAEQNTKLVEHVSVIQPKADVADRIAMSEGYITITDAAKILKVRPRWFGRWLRVNRWVYQRPGHRAMIPYQERITSEYMDLKYILVPSAEDKDRTFPQGIFLPKGIAKLAAIFEKGVVGVEHE